jgi:uracil-DNA glycosylase
MNDVQIEESWKNSLQACFQEPWFNELTNHIKEEILAGKRIYPPGKFIFNAFNYTPLPQVKVVILGQDPYHGAGQAHGLSFSVPDGIKAPPSLVNIFKEIKSDLGKPIPPSGNLERWANQGVLLLNAILTVRAEEAASHRNLGWERFTDAVIQTVSNHQTHVVFLLWGRYAHEKAALIDQNKHLVLKAAHPSPLSAHNGFFGCKHFSMANEWLLEKGITTIEW